MGPPVTLATPPPWMAAGGNCQAPRPEDLVDQDSTLPLAEQDVQTAAELRAMLERAGLDLWEHPEIERALQAEDLSMADRVQRRRDILEYFPRYAPTDGWISSTFGKRRAPAYENVQFHKGIDIAANIGTQVVAPADGTVRFAGSYGGFGKFVSVVHGYGIITKYAHNSELLVRAGDKVKAGDVIAKVGSSGKSRGMHLHYEVWINDKPLDPLGFMPPVPGLSEDDGERDSGDDSGGDDLAGADEAAVSE